MAADSYTALVKEFEKSAEATPSGDRTRVSRLALRDGAIALAALSLWAAADAWYAATDLAAAALLSVLDGLAAGAGSACSRTSGDTSRARAGAAGSRRPRASPSSSRSSCSTCSSSPERAFQAMSVGGNVAHWSLVAAAVPLGAARCARTRRARVRRVRVRVRRERDRGADHAALVRGRVAGRELRGAHGREAAPRPLDRHRRGRGAIRDDRVIYSAARPLPRSPSRMRRAISETSFATDACHHRWSARSWIQPIGPQPNSTSST